MRVSNLYSTLYIKNRQMSFSECHLLKIFQRPSGKKNGAEKSDGRKTEVEGKTSETVANGTVASKEEATETTAVEAVKEPELSEEEKERMRLQEEDEKRREEIVS